MSTKIKSYSAVMTVLGVLALVLIFLTHASVGAKAEAASPGPAGADKKAAGAASKPPPSFDGSVSKNALKMIEQGRRIFRFDTFGSEAFWGDTLQLHKAIAGEKNGGVGGGVSPKTALSVGLKVDADALPDSLKQQLKNGKVDLDDPAITLALLKLNAVVGVTGYFDQKGGIRSMGLQCAFCHSNAAARGKQIFDVKGQCATCHVPPLFTEPGNNLHSPTEIGVDSFQADRSPTHMYRTAPLAGLWSHQKAGFYHDGRFATLGEVIGHYDTFLGLKLTEREKLDLIEYLKSL
jgi:hypothetical protein